MYWLVVVVAWAWDSHFRNDERWERGTDEAHIADTYRNTIYVAFGYYPPQTHTAHTQHAFHSLGIRICNTQYICETLKRMKPTPMNDINHLSGWINDTFSVSCFFIFSIIGGLDGSIFHFAACLSLSEHMKLMNKSMGIIIIIIKGRKCRLHGGSMLWPMQQWLVDGHFSWCLCQPSMFVKDLLTTLFKRATRWFYLWHSIACGHITIHETTKPIFHSNINT